MILSNHGVFQSGKSPQTPVVDPYASSVVLFLKTNESLLTTNTTTTADFTVPAVNSTVIVDVVSTAWATANRAIRVGGSAGNYIITAVNSGTQLTIRNCGGSSNTTAGTTITSGATIALSIIDYSPTPKLLDAFGNVQLTADGLYFDGTGDKLNVSDSSFAFGTADATIEFYCNSEDVSSSTQRGFYQLSDTPGGIKPSYSNSLLTLQGANGTSNNTGGLTTIANSQFIGAASQISVGNLFHVAISINSGVVRQFVNGILTNTLNVGANLTGTHLCVGGYYSDSYLYRGLLSKYRITAGVGRYTTNFNPSTDSYLN